MLCEYIYKTSLKMTEFQRGPGAWLLGVRGNGATREAHVPGPSVSEWQ